MERRYQQRGGGRGCFRGEHAQIQGRRPLGPTAFASTANQRRLTRLFPPDVTRAAVYTTAVPVYTSAPTHTGNIKN